MTTLRVGVSGSLGKRSYASKAETLTMVPVIRAFWARQASAPLDLAAHYRGHGDVFADDQVIDALTRKRRRARAENDPRRKAELVWAARPRERPGKRLDPVEVSGRKPQRAAMGTSAKVIKSLDCPGAPYRYIWDHSA